MIVSVVAALLHEYVRPPPAMRVSAFPIQICAELSVMVATGRVLTITVFDSVAEHELESVTVTEYGVLIIGETIMVSLFIPLLHT